tara:strand:- start:341 stop:1063 length:723 start_codon:yes stop_codon:yes gene_type:complete
MCVFAVPAALTVAGGASAAAAAAAAQAALMANIGLAVSAATTAMTFYGQSQQASAQNAMMEQRQRLGTERALANYANQTRQARAQQLQQREAASQQINEVYRESRKRIATAQVSGAEGGVAGSSLQALVNDFHRQHLEFGTDTRRNLQFAESNIEDQLESARIGAQANIENLQFMPAERPSFLGAALRIGGAGLGAWQQYQTNVVGFGPAPSAGTSGGSFPFSPSYGQDPNFVGPLPGGS